MKLTFKSKYVTLDWDNIDNIRAIKRFVEICNSGNTRQALLSKSAFKGFHCRIWLFNDVLIARYRLAFQDDPLRILHDLFNRDPRVHDILWSRKSIRGVAHKSKPIISYDSGDGYGIGRTFHRLSDGSIFYPSNPNRGSDRIETLLVG